MNPLDEARCINQADIFEASVDLLPCASSYFCFRFMKSELAKRMDRFTYYDDAIGIDYAFSFLKGEYPTLMEGKEGEKYPKQVMRWIGMVYRAYAIKKKRRSNWIYAKLKAEDLLSLYNVYHTFDLDYCVDRLEELIEERNGNPSDYEVYSRIRLKHID